MLAEYNFIVEIYPKWIITYFSFKIERNLQFFDINLFTTFFILFWVLQCLLPLDLVRTVCSDRMNCIYYLRTSSNSSAVEKFWENRICTSALSCQSVIWGNPWCNLNLLYKNSFHYNNFLCNVSNKFYYLNFSIFTTLFVCDFFKK